MDRFEHFVAAQQPVYDRVEQELAAGRKRTHWMWFVFPQLAGLGQSEMSRRFALATLAEARAYLTHPLLGPRLRRCTELVNGVENRSAHAIFGSPDDFKFHSSTTLFARAGAGTAENAAFGAALAKYFGGREDERTVALLKERDDG